MSEQTEIKPGDTWVITIPVGGSGFSPALHVEAILDWAKKEGVRPPLILFGGTVHIIDKENQE